MSEQYQKQKQKWKEQGYQDAVVLVKEHIHNLLKQFKTTKFVEDYRNRIDEVFLLYLQLKDTSFIDTCAVFGINYNLFNKIISYDENNQEQREALMKLRNELK